MAKYFDAEKKEGNKITQVQKNQNLLLLFAQQDCVLGAVVAGVQVRD